MKETSFYMSVENMIVQQDTEGEAIIVRISEDKLNGDELFVLNKLGYALWKAGKEKKQIIEVINEIHLCFDNVDIETISSDVLSFLDKMREKGLIQIFE